MIDRWRAWMHRRGSGKFIDREDGRDYLHRYYLWRLPWAKLFPCAGFLHEFFSDDPDDPHDHPWPWGRLIVRGRYREHYHDGTHQDFGPGHVMWRRQAKVLHRIELLTLTATTLFWHWRRERDWGFMEPDGWRPASDQGNARQFRGWIFPRRSMRNA